MVSRKEKDEAPREHGDGLFFSVVRRRKDLVRPPSLNDNSFYYWLCGASLADLPLGGRWFSRVLGERAGVHNTVDKVLSIC